MFGTRCIELYSSIRAQDEPLASPQLGVCDFSARFAVLGGMVQLPHSKPPFLVELLAQLGLFQLFPLPLQLPLHLLTIQTLPRTLKHKRLVRGTRAGHGPWAPLPSAMPGWKAGLDSAGATMSMFLLEDQEYLHQRKNLCVELRV